jgi:hypothetical protein
MEYDNKMYAEYTKYPRIFLGAYWGTHRLGKNESPIRMDSFNTICDNRNKFKHEYYIKKYYELPAIRGRSSIEQSIEILDENGRDIRDHKEYYKCEDGTIIALFSKYVGNDDKTHSLILSKGYTMIDPLYAEDQTTYIKNI